jgi:two-component system, NtrC family, response regulator AtoC
MSSALKPPLMAENPLQAFRLLVVSKEPAVVRSLASLAENSRWQVEIASSGWDAMERLESGTAPELLLLDLPRSDGDSFHMLRWLRRLSPGLPVVAICDAEDSLVRQEAMRLGAERILSRPLDAHQVQLLMRSYSGGEMDSAELASKYMDRRDPEAFFISASHAMQKLRAQAELLAQSDVPVFIVGERGSGKATVARLIHGLSLRSAYRFQQVNCAGLPHHSFESKMELGERGTILFSEITAMPAELQARLLDALNNLEAIKNTGPGNPHNRPHEPAEVRILSATSENLERALAEGRLNRDLYRRLSAFTLQVPSLRQRREEIPVLLNHIMRKLGSQYGLAAREFSPDLLASYEQYEWPGNVAELEEFVRRHLAGNAEDLPGTGRAASWAGVGDAGSDRHGYRAPEERHDRRSVFSGAAGAAAIPAERENADHSPAGASGALAPQSLKSLIQDIKSEAERKAIGAALDRTGWNRKAAARLLRVSYRTLLYKIEQYQMKAAPFFSPSPVEGLAEGSAGKPDGKAS